MPTPVDQQMYERAKAYVRQHYKKPSAYASGAIVKKYKAEFKKKYGEKEPYKEDEEHHNLQKWFQEDWKDVGHKDYPVYRPTKRIDASTPLLPKEISNLKEQIELKQKIKGKSNLPPFKPK